MSTEKIREARSYINEAYLQEAADVLVPASLEDSRSTDETERIRKHHRRWLSIAAVILLFLFVVLPFSRKGYGGGAFWGTIVDGTLYYRSKFGLSAYDPLTEKNRLAVWGDLGAGITHRGKEVFYVKGSTLYAYDTFSRDKRAVYTVSDSNLEIFDKIPESGPVLVRYLASGSYRYVTVEPETGERAPYDAPKEWDVFPYHYVFDVSGHTVEFSYNEEEFGQLYYSDPKLGKVNIAVWSFWEDRLLLGRSGTWVKICDLSEGKNVMINVPKAVEDQTSIGQLGLRFDGEWLYIAIPGYNDRIFVYHCTFNGTFWQAELIGKVYQGGS